MNPEAAKLSEQSSILSSVDNLNGGEPLQENLECSLSSAELADLFQKLMKRLAHIQAGRTFSREEMNERR